MISKKKCENGVLKHYGDYVTQLMFCKNNDMKLCTFARTCSQCNSSVMIENSSWERCKYRNNVDK